MGDLQNEDGRLCFCVRLSVCLSPLAGSTADPRSGAQRCRLRRGAGPSAAWETSRDTASARGLLPPAGVSRSPPQNTGMRPRATPGPRRLPVRVSAGLSPRSPELNETSKRGGSLGGSAVEHLPSAQGITLGPRDRVPCQAPSMEPAPPSAWVSAPPLYAYHE